MSDSTSDLKAAFGVCSPCGKDIMTCYMGECDKRSNTPEHDPVNHPAHYTHGSIEPIAVIEDWKLGYCLGNVIKYLARAEHKGATVQDLKKARWHLDREITRREKGAEK